MMIVGVAGARVVPAVPAVPPPRSSRCPRNGARRVPGAGSGTGSRAPGPLGRRLGEPFGSRSRAVGRSDPVGRRTHRHLPV
nr:DUF6411 family protein [Streptomyces chilikensis]